MMCGVLLAAALFVECEGFDSVGGCVTDTTTVRQMGSAYLMAHGYGRPVADATTTLSVGETGDYTVWARTRNWAAEWSNASPGRFEVVVDGVPLGGIGGTEGRDWHWQKLGRVALAAGDHRIALHDLTGFNGRCDALYLATDPDAKPGRPETPVVDCTNRYDLVVVGGGVPGIAAVIAANLTGAILGSARAARLMAPRGKGVIVNISSVCAIHAWPGWSVYTAAKAELLKFSHALHTEMRPRGVKVTCVIPSWGQTDFNRAAGISGASEDPVLAAKCMSPEQMGEFVLGLIRLPVELTVPEVTIQPMVQDIVPM